MTPLEVVQNRTVEQLSRFGRYNGHDTVEGPASVLLIGVHGNEINGLIAFELVRRKISRRLQQGILDFGWGNPRAIRIGERQTDQNLNRMFRPDKDMTLEERVSYEYQRAQEIKKVLEGPATALMDVHGTLNPITKPHIIAEANAAELISTLPVDIVVSGFDEFEPGGTDYYMNHIGKIGICLESGWNEDQSAVKLIEEVIFAFLVAQGHMTGEEVKRAKNYYRLFYVHKTESHFYRKRKFNDFENVDQGEIIGRDGDKVITAPASGILLYCGKEERTIIGEEAFINARRTATLV